SPTTNTSHDPRFDKGPLVTVTPTRTKPSAKNARSIWAVSATAPSPTRSAGAPRQRKPSGRPPGSVLLDASKVTRCPTLTVAGPVTTTSGGALILASAGRSVTLVTPPSVWTPP